MGILLGSLLWGPIVDEFATADGHSWQQIWVVPAAIAAVVLVLFLIFFREREAPHEKATPYESSTIILEP